MTTRGYVGADTSLPNDAANNSSRLVAKGHTLRPTLARESNARLYLGLCVVVAKTQLAMVVAWTPSRPCSPETKPGLPSDAAKQAPARGALAEFPASVTLVGRPPEPSARAHPHLASAGHQVRWGPAAKSLLRLWTFATRPTSQMTLLAQTDRSCWIPCATRRTET